VTPNQGGPKQIIDGFNRDLPDPCRVELTQTDGMVELTMLVGDDRQGGPAIGLDGELSTADQDFLWLLRTAQGEFIENELGEAWPRCPAHGSHPLVPAADAWRCPDVMSDSRRWLYGNLSEQTVPPEPERRDGEVRWYVDDLGWGVIATTSGDCFVLWHAIDGAGYRSLREGQLVEYDVDRWTDGRPMGQGRFHLRATWVGPID
jgi:CspA family cold shock protein